MARWYACRRSGVDHGALIPHAAYAYLLGVYLGDGHISPQPREVYRLLVSCDAAYPGLIDETADAMRRVLPANKVSSYLAGWQAEITADDPRPLVRGLLFVGPKRRHEPPLP